MTENECLKIGGHCWIEKLIGTSLDHIRECKHCGKKEEEKVIPEKREWI